jgi:phage-related protein
VLNDEVIQPDKRSTGSQHVGVFRKGGEYRQTCTIPAGAEDGTYQVTVQATDVVGNYRGTGLNQADATFTVTR